MAGGVVGTIVSLFGLWEETNKGTSSYWKTTRRPSMDEQYEWIQERHTISGRQTIYFQLREPRASQRSQRESGGTTWGGFHSHYCHNCRLSSHPRALQATSSSSGLLGILSAQCALIRWDTIFRSTIPCLSTSKHPQSNLRVRLARDGQQQHQTQWPRHRLHPR